MDGPGCATGGSGGAGEEPYGGSPNSEVRQRLGRPVAVITAVAGSGKSLLLDRLMQRAIVRYRENDGVPLQVFLEATEVQGRLLEAIAERTSSLGRPQEHGVALFLAGLEEAERARARTLLDEAHYLPDMWPNTTVVAARRPIQELEEISERGKLWNCPNYVNRRARPLYGGLRAMSKGLWDTIGHALRGGSRSARFPGLKPAEGACYFL